MIRKVNISMSNYLISANRKIKAARAALGMTQNDLANRLNVSPSAISKWETDISKVNFGDVIMICQILKIDISELVG